MISIITKALHFRFGRDNSEMDIFPFQQFLDQILYYLTDKIIRWLIRGETVAVLGVFLVFWRELERDDVKKNKMK